MEMYERICLVRKSLKMNQGAFAAALGFAQSTIAMIEVGKREISERHIKAICSQFQINEEWLRTGTGSMRVETKDDYINQLVQRYNGSDLMKKVIKAFIDLNDEERKAVLKFIDNLDPEPTGIATVTAYGSTESTQAIKMSPDPTTAPNTSQIEVFEASRSNEIPHRIKSVPQSEIDAALNDNEVKGDDDTLK